MKPIPFKRPQKTGRPHDLIRAGCAALLLALLGSAANAQPHPESLGVLNDSLGILAGADVSFIPQIEDLGGIYSEDGLPKDPLGIFKDHGFDCIRLKLWHTPADPYNTLEKILDMAVRIKALGLQWLLDFHYSDTWADPGRQTKPAAWQGLSFAALTDSVYEYTKRVVQVLADQNTPPDMVQIGNEITSGMLWNDGRVGGSYNTPQQWKNLGDLLKAGIRGVREGAESGDSIRVIIHLDRGGDNGGCQWFFDNLNAQSVPFDIIGLSFYPWWHGTLSNMRTNLNDLAGRYNKDIMIVETAYPWTLQWLDSRSNIVGSPGQLHTGYPATIDGQTDFLEDLIGIVRSVRNHRGTGIFYWAPEYISVQPGGSPWENCTLFDFDGNVLPSMDAFLAKPVNLTPVNVTIRLNTSTLMDTLQEDHITQIRGQIDGPSGGTLPGGTEVTWGSDSDLILDNAGGDYWETTFPMYSGDTLSYKFWSGFTLSRGTFQRLGWEGPITPAGGLSGNRRVLIARETDTVVDIQYYNSSGETSEQYGKPFESKDDTLTVYFRVNMGPAVLSGRFDPDTEGPMAVRGDSAASGGSLLPDISLVTLGRESMSVNNGSFWSGACAIPRNAVQAGTVLEYKFFIENDDEDGWENIPSNRTLTFTESLAETGRDTTLHWVYFERPDSSTSVPEDGRNEPRFFRLEQNFPNPFNHQTTIRYILTQAGFVKLSVCDVHGRPTASLVHEVQTAGHHSVSWNGLLDDGSPAASGMYFARLETVQGIEIRKTLLLK